MLSHSGRDGNIADDETSHLGCGKDEFCHVAVTRSSLESYLGQLEACKQGGRGVYCAIAAGIANLGITYCCDGWPRISQSKPHDIVVTASRVDCFSPSPNRLSKKPSTTTSYACKVAGLLSNLPRRR
jgi:hypothetical protein